MTADRKTAFAKLREWATPKITAKALELEERIFQVLPMENTGDVFYEINRCDSAVMITYVGANESYRVTIRSDIIYLMYSTRRRELEQREPEDPDTYMWWDYHWDKYFSWNDNTIPVEKRRMPVLDASQWEFTYSEKIKRFSEYEKCEKYAHNKTEYFEDILETTVEKLIYI